MSFSFLSAVARILRDAGLAGNMRSSPVKGSLRLPALRAGTWRSFSLSRSGITNSPGPFLPSSRLMSSLRPAKMPATSFFDRPVFSDRVPVTVDLLNFLPPAPAAGAAFLLAISSSYGSHGQNDHGLLRLLNPAFCPVFEAFDEPVCTDCPHLCTRQSAPQHLFGAEPGKNPKKV